MLKIFKNFSYVHIYLNYPRLHFAKFCSKCSYFQCYQQDDRLDKSFHQSLEKFNQYSDSSSQLKIDNNSDLVSKCDCVHISKSKDEVGILEEKNWTTSTIPEDTYSNDDLCFHNTDRQWSQNLKQEFFSNINLSQASTNLKSLWLSHRSRQYLKRYDHESFVSFIFERQNFERMLSVLENELSFDRIEASLFLSPLRYTRKTCFSQTGAERLITDFENLIRFLKTHFTLEEVKNNPYLLLFRYLTIQNRTQFLKDFGVTKLRPWHIINFRFIIDCNQDQLKQFGIIEEEIDIVDCMLNCLKDLNNDDKKQFKAELSLSSSVRNLKTSICEKYLKKNVNHSYYSIPRLIVNSHVCLSKLYNVFKKLDQVNLPTVTLSMSSWRTIFEMKSDTLNDMFERIPQLYNKRILEFILVNPNVLKLPYALLLSKLDLLKNHYQLKDEQIEFNPETMRIRIDLLKSKLDYLIKLFGSDILKEFNVLSLASMPKKEIDRLKTSEDESLHKLENNFSLKFKALKCKKRFDTKKKIDLISQSLGLSRKLIKASIRSHPFKNCIDLNNCKQVWQFFSSQHLTSTQMSNGLLILLYDINLIIQTWTKLKQSEGFQEWKNDENLLVYLVYLIEKDYQMDGKAALIGKMQPKEAT